MKPNLIERLENLMAALDQTRDELIAYPAYNHSALSRLDDADGIAGEILTMIDGR